MRDPILSGTFLLAVAIPFGLSLNFGDVPCGKNLRRMRNLRTPRIIGGVPASPGEFPWLVSIKWLHDSHFCAGIIIDRKHIISAAHCFRDFDMTTYDPSQMEVVVGEHYQHKESKSKENPRSKVARVMIHPDYQDTNKIHDIAVLKLQENITWSSTAQPACLSDEDSKSESDNLTGLVAGWGLTKIYGSHNNKFPNELRKVEVPVWSQSRCFSFLANNFKNYQGGGDEQICAGSTSRGACDGDSGGALMIKKQETFQVVGIVSGRLEEGCGSGLPGLYTRVSHYTNWIKTLI